MRAILKYLYILLALSPLAARAQGPTYTIPQSVQATLATATACTGTTQTFSTATPALNAIGFRNLGQTQHQITVIPSGTTTNLKASILGQDTLGNTFQISDTMIAFGTGSTPIVQGNGSFPIIIIQVICNSGTFSLSYSGTSSTSNSNSGNFLVSAIDKTILAFWPEGSSVNNPTFITPFGNSAGTLSFLYNGTAIAGSLVSVFCTNVPVSTGTSYLIDIPNTAGTSLNFQVPSGPCPNVAITYTSGGAGVGTVTLDYVFSAPGSALPPPVYTHVTGTTATTIKPGSGTLHSLVVGTPAAGTISLFDLRTAACTGTPATNVVSVITEFASATPPPPAYIFDVLFNNGICVKASAAMDITVSSQ